MSTLTPLLHSVREHRKHQTPPTEVETPLRRVVQTSGVKPYTPESHNLLRTSLVNVAAPRFGLERMLVRFFLRHPLLLGLLELFVVIATSISFITLAGLREILSSQALAGYAILLVGAGTSMLYLMFRFEELEIRCWQHTEVYPWSEDLPDQVKLTLQKLWCHIQKSGLKGVGFYVAHLVAAKIKDPLFVVYRKDPQTGEIKEEYCCEAWHTPAGFQDILRRIA